MTVLVVPDRAMSALRAQAAAAAIAGLALARAMEEALLALASEGVPVAVLKGPAIAQQFYADADLRPYRDIDLLVPLDAHERVASVCARLGYAFERASAG